MRRGTGLVCSRKEGGVPWKMYRVARKEEKFGETFRGRASTRHRSKFPNPFLSPFSNRANCTRRDLKPVSRYPCQFSIVARRCTFSYLSVFRLSLSPFLYLTFRFPSIRLPCSSFRRKCGSNGERVGGGVSITEGRTGNYGNRAAIKSEIEMEERELDERAVVQIESLLRHSNPRVFLLVDAPRTKFSLSLCIPVSFPRRLSP